MGDRLLTFWLQANNQKPIINAYNSMTKKTFLLHISIIKIVPTNMGDSRRQTADDNKSGKMLWKLEQDGSL